MRKQLLIGTLAILVFLTVFSGCVEEQTTVSSGTTNRQSTGPKYTTFFTNITVDDAHDLLNNSTNLTIIDCRNKDVYEIEWIPNAMWENTPAHFYNATNDLLIYSHNGGFSIEFCNNLIPHTYGAIYNLEGGIEAWKTAGYETETVFTTFYTNITVEEAVELINTSANLTIIDCRPCKCQFTTRIPHAIWDDDHSNYYFTTNDLLIYSEEGIVSTGFCNNLVRQTYGAIYNLEGGFNAWKQAGYDIETD